MNCHYVMWYGVAFTLVAIFSVVLVCMCLGARGGYSWAYLIWNHKAIVDMWNPSSADLLSIPEPQGFSLRWQLSLCLILSVLYFDLWRQLHPQTASLQNEADECGGCEWQSEIGSDFSEEPLSVVAVWLEAHVNLTGCCCASSSCTKDTSRKMWRGKQPVLLFVTNSPTATVKNNGICCLLAAPVRRHKYVSTTDLWFVLFEMTDGGINWMCLSLALFICHIFFQIFRKHKWLDIEMGQMDYRI